VSAAFTKGPWAVHPDIPFAVEPAICECFGQTCAEANARLIAAAPELYACLAALVTNAEEVEHDFFSLAGHEDFKPAETLARAAAAALAKARGEA
jgi:hypothetical protein